jgi:pre-mRNA-processing factor 17
VCQEYNYHLQPCSTITFFDEGRRFVSTSDDKKLLVPAPAPRPTRLTFSRCGNMIFLCRSNISKTLACTGPPVPPLISLSFSSTLCSIPSVTLSPSGRAFAGQSMDNSIVVYQCGDKVSISLYLCLSLLCLSLHWSLDFSSSDQVKKMSRKIFRGHTNVGYACQVGFSPNSKFIMSGDSTGKLHVWDWKSTKVPLSLSPLTLLIFFSTAISKVSSS